MFKKIIRKYYNKFYNHREEDHHTLKYYTYKDFKGMKKEDFSFKSNNGQILRGAFFFKDEISNYKDIIIFCHGAGGGYLYYMKEINELVSQNFLVLTYDYTGTFSSDGEKLCGFSQPVIDLFYLIKKLNKDEVYSKYSISLIGHSWGGFTVLNILNFNLKIKNVVALSPVISNKAVFKMFIPRIAWPFVLPEAMKYEEELFGNFSRISALDVMNKKNNILVIASTKDPIVNTNTNFMKLKNKNTKANHKFILMNNKLHTPQYTVDAANYYNYIYRHYLDVFKKNHIETDEEKAKYFSKIDYERATKIDKDVFVIIGDFLRS